MVWIRGPSFAPPIAWPRERANEHVGASIPPQPSWMAILPWEEEYDPAAHGQHGAPSSSDEPATKARSASALAHACLRRKRWSEYSGQRTDSVFPFGNLIQS